MDFLYISKKATNHNYHVGGQFSSIHSFEYAAFFLQCENSLPLHYLSTRVDNYQHEHFRWFGFSSLCQIQK